MKCLLSFKLNNNKTTLSGIAGEKIQNISMPAQYNTIFCLK